MPPGWDPLSRHGRANGLILALWSEAQTALPVQRRFEFVPGLATRTYYRPNSNPSILSGSRDENVGLISISQLFGVRVRSCHADLTMAESGSTFKKPVGVVAQTALYECNLDGRVTPA